MKLKTPKLTYFGSNSSVNAHDIREYVERHKKHRFEQFCGIYYFISGGIFGAHDVSNVGHTPVFRESVTCY
jgi:hypothetical protein